MWKRIAPFLILLSVALNVAFVGVWAFRAVRSHWPSGRGEAGAVWCPLHRRLDVTDEQWRQIEPRLNAFRKDSQSLCKHINRLRREMIDLIAGEHPQRRTIAAKQEEIRAGQRRMQELVVEHLLAEKEVLTPEQEKELFDLLRRRSACAGPGRMMGLSNPTTDLQPTASDRHEDRTPEPE